MSKQIKDGNQIICNFNIKEEEFEEDDPLVTWTFLAASASPANRALMLNVIYSYAGKIEFKYLNCK